MLVTPNVPCPTPKYVGLRFACQHYLQPDHNREDVVQRIPEEILSAICHETEDRSSSFRSSVTRKHLKNLNTLTLSQVCRTWRFHIKNDTSLWKDIAFDVCDIRSVNTAELFLAVMEKADILFAVFVDLYGDPSRAVGILTRLQLLTSRISHFESFGALGGCRRYLNRPAENLQHLSGSLDLDSTTTILSNPLFAGHTPQLRSVTMAAIIHCTGWATLLPHLTELELVAPRFGHALPFKSLLNVLQGAPNLRDLKLSGLGFIVDASHSGHRATLLHLETLTLNESDVQTMVRYLEMPRLRKTTFYGSDYPPGYDVLAPVFQAHHLFSHTSLIPILKQEIAEVFLMAGKIGEDRRFWLRLLSSCRRHSLDIRMYWSQGTVGGWEGYTERSVVALAKLVTLSPRAHIGLDFQPPFSRPLAIPFFQSPHVHYLTINGGLAEELSRSLTLVFSPLPQLGRLEITDKSSAPAQALQAIESRLSTRGIELMIRTSRGTLPLFDAFDLPDTGYIIFSYLLRFFGRTQSLSSI